MSVTPAEARTLAPPARRAATITANEAVGAYRLLTAHDHDGPEDPRPGQFYMLAAEEHWGGPDGRPYLPRAFSYARARRPGGGGPGVELDFLLEAIGPGTNRLGELRPGERLLLLGPLGCGFRPGSGRPLVVGGGIGVAPLFCLAEDLRPQTSDLRILVGFRSSAHAEAARLFDADVTLATDDGSTGRAGLVTDLLREALEPEHEATIYACGPPQMLEAIRLLSADLGVPAQLAVEAGMACGFGACFGCVVPTRDGYARVCVDGPVFDAQVLRSDV
jgi:dihydroorotate dehydrogenase electron transfer subunit